MYKYEEISNSLKEQIQSGKYPAGAPLPDQNHLAVQFNTTRITIRKALQNLIIEGIVYTKRGSGTFVRKDFEKSIPDSESMIDKPIGTTRTHPKKKVTSKILRFEARLPNDQEQEKLLISSVDPVYVIERTRYIDKKIFCHEYTVMPTEIAKISKKILKGSIYNYLSDIGLTISGSHRVITADKAQGTDISELNLEVNDPVLVINQISYLEDGTPFEYSESRFPYQSGKIIADINLDKN